MAREHVPQSHKVALREFAPGEPVLRYGQAIGHANRAIRAGCWVREEFLDTARAAAARRTAARHRRARPHPPLEGYTFEGYRNADGTVGHAEHPRHHDHGAMRRAHGGLCGAAHPARAPAALPERGRCGRASPTPTAAAWPSTRPAPRCRSARCATSACIPTSAARRWWSAWAARSCSRRACSARNCAGAGRRSNVIRLQDDARLRRHRRPPSCEAAEKRLAELDSRRRVTCPASDLVVGLQCGGSDAFSGVTCNPAVGYAADLLVRAGATVMFSEVTEVRDAVHLLTPRAVNAGGRARADSRDALVRRLPGARRRRPQRQPHAGQQARRAGERRGEGAGLGREGGHARALARGSLARRDASPRKDWSSPPRRPAISSAAPSNWPRMNLHVFTTGEGTPVRPGAGSGGEGLVAHGAGRAMARPDRYRRRPHRDRRTRPSKMWAGNSSGSCWTSPAAARRPGRITGACTTRSRPSIPVR